MSIRRAAAVLLGLALAGAAGAAGAERPVRASAESAGGVRLATFETPQGTIQAYLPADLQRGDCASGAVRLDPAGRNAAARRASATALARHKLRFGGESVPVNTTFAAWHVAAGAAGSESLSLVSPEGKELARTEAPVSPATSTPSGTRLPILAEAGGTGAASGRFGCEAPRVRLGGTPAEVLAASPRIVVFSVPQKLLGARSLEVLENGTSVKGTVHVVSIALVSPRTKLKRGEQTTATVVVSGLSGLKESVTLTLTNESAGVVSMDGGNVQPLTIQPAAVGRDGTFRAERVLTGVEPGTFTIAAVLPLPDERRPVEKTAEKPPVPTPVREDVPTPASTPVHEEVPTAAPSPAGERVTPAQPSSPSEPATPDPGVPWWVGGLVVALGAAALLVPVKPRSVEPVILGWMGGDLPPGVEPGPVWDPKKIEEALRKAVEDVTKAGERLRKSGEDYNRANEDYAKAQEEYLRAKEYYDWLLDLLTHWRPLDAPYGGPKIRQRTIHREKDEHGGLKPPTKGDLVEEDAYTRRMTQREVEEELQKAKAAMDHAFDVVKKKSAEWTKAREALDKAGKDVKDGVDWVDFWRKELALGPPEARPQPAPVRPFDPLEGVERIGGQPALVEYGPRLVDPLTPEQRQKLIDEWKERVPAFPPSRGSGPGPGDLTFDGDGYLTGWWLPPAYSIEEEIRYHGRGPAAAPGEGGAPPALESRAEAPLILASEQPAAWVKDGDGNWVPVDPATGRRREEMPPARTPEAAERARKRAEGEMKRRDEAYEKEREKAREDERKRREEAELERLARQRDFVPPEGAPPGTWVRGPSGRWIEIDPKTGAPLVKTPPERSPEEAEAARKKAEEVARKRDAADHERVRKAEEERDKEQREGDEERWAEEGRRAAAPPPAMPAIPRARTPEEEEAARKKAEEEMKRRDEAYEKAREKARADEEERHRVAEEERRRAAGEREKAAKEEEEERLYGQGRRDAASPPPVGPGAWVKDGDGRWVPVDPKTGRPVEKVPPPRTPEEAEAARKKAEAEMKRREEAHEKGRETARAEEEKRAQEEESERLLRQGEAGEPPAAGEVWARDRHGRWVPIDPRTGMPVQSPRRERTPEEAEAARKKAEGLVMKRDAADHRKVEKAEEEREKKSRAADEERWGGAPRPDPSVPPGPGAWVKDPAGRWVEVDPRTGRPVRRERTPEEAEAARKRAEKEMERRERVYQEQRKKRQEAEAKRRWELAHPPPPAVPAAPKPPPPPPPPPGEPIRDDVRAWARETLDLTDENHPLVQILIGMGHEVGVEKLRDLLRDFRPSDPVRGLVELLEKLQPKTGAPGERLRARQAILEILNDLARDPVRLRLWGVTDPTSLTPLFRDAVSKLVDEALADGSFDALLHAAVALARPKELGGNPEDPRAGALREAIGRHLDDADAAKNKEDYVKLASGALDEPALRELAKNALKEHRLAVFAEASLAALEKSNRPAAARAAEAIEIAQALKKLATLPVEPGMTPESVRAVELLRKKARAGLDALKKGFDEGLVPTLDGLVDEAVTEASRAAGEASAARHDGSKEKEVAANERRQAAVGEILDLGRLREMLATSPLDEAAAKRELGRRVEEAGKAVTAFEKHVGQRDGGSENTKGRNFGHLGALRARRDAIQDVLRGFDPGGAIDELDRIYDALNGTWHGGGDIYSVAAPDGTGSRSHSAKPDFRENGIRQKLDEARRHGTPDEVRRLEEDLDYNERRRIQVLLGHPGWDGLDNYVRIKEHEKGYWQSQKNWKELAWLGEMPADRWAAEIPAYRSRDLPGLISAVNREMKNPQGFIRFLAKLRAEDVRAGASAWEAYFATPWHDRGLVVQTWRLAHVKETLDRMGSDHALAETLRAAGEMPVERLKATLPEGYKLLEGAGFISMDRYAVPGDFTYTPETVGSEMGKRHWLDDILNVKNVAEVVLTVLVPAAGAHWLVDGAGILQAARGASKLAKGGTFLARTAFEAALFTVFSKGTKGAIHPFSLTGQELSPEALAKETATNFAAMLGLGVLGRVAAPLERILIGEGKAVETLLKPMSQIWSEKAAAAVILLKKTGFEGVKLTLEAGGMTALSGELDPKTFPQAFLHNLVFLAELKALNPEAWNEARKGQTPAEREAARPREAAKAPEGAKPGEGRQPVIAEGPGKLEVDEFRPDSDEPRPKGKEPAGQPSSPIRRLAGELGLKGTDGLKEKILDKLDRLAKNSPDVLVREAAANAKRAIETGQVPLAFGTPRARGDYDPVAKIDPTTKKELARKATINPIAIANGVDAYMRAVHQRPATAEEFLTSLAGTVVHEALVHAYQGVDAMKWNQGQTRPYSLLHEIEAFMVQRRIDPTLGGKDQLGPWRTDPSDILEAVVDIVTKGYADAVDPVRKRQLEAMKEAEFFGHTTPAGEAKVGERAAKLRGLRGEEPPAKAEAVSGEGPAKPPEPIASLDDIDADGPDPGGGRPPEHPGGRFLRELGIGGLKALRQRLVDEFAIFAGTSGDPLKREVADAAEKALKDREITFSVDVREGTTFDPATRRATVNLAEIAEHLNLRFAGRGEAARGPDFLRALMGHVARQAWGHGLGKAATFGSEEILHAGIEGHVAQRLFDPSAFADPASPVEALRERAAEKLVKKYPELRHMRELGLRTISGLRDLLTRRARAIAEAPGDARKQEAARVLVLLLEGGAIDLSTTWGPARGGYDPVTRRVVLHLPAIAVELEALWLDKGRPATPEEFLDSLIGTLVHEGVVHRLQGFDTKPQADGLTRPYRRAHEVEAYLLQRLFDPSLGSKDAVSISGTEKEVLDRIVRMVAEKYPDKKIGGLNTTIVNDVDPLKLERWRRALADAEEILRTHGDPEVVGDLLYREIESLLFDRTIPAKDVRVREKAAKLRDAWRRGIPPDLYPRFRDAAQRRALLGEVARVAAGFDLTRWRESVRGLPDEEQRLLQILRDAGIGDPGAAAGGSGELDARLSSVATPPKNLDAGKLKADLDAAMDALAKDPRNERLLRRALRLRTLLGGLGAFEAAGPAADFPLVVDAPGKDGVSTAEALQLLLAETRRTEAEFRSDAALRAHVARLRAAEAALRARGALEGPPVVGKDLDAALDGVRWDEFWPGLRGAQRRVLGPLLREAAR